MERKCIEIESKCIKQCLKDCKDHNIEILYQCLLAEDVWYKTNNQTLLFLLCSHWFKVYKLTDLSSFIEYVVRSWLLIRQKTQSEEEDGLEHDPSVQRAQYNTQPLFAIVVPLKWHTDNFIPTYMGYLNVACGLFLFSYSLLITKTHCTYYWTHTNMLK